MRAVHSSLQDGRIEREAEGRMLLSFLTGIRSASRRKQANVIAISVITPSRNMLPQLRRCSASVADQDSEGVEHIVQDACSTDGTVAWLQKQSMIDWCSEPDGGMYDALNRGIARSQGELLGYLNCDEQYLPGTLSFVRSYFRDHQEVDILFGSALVVDGEGQLLASRRSYFPHWTMMGVSHLYNLSCAMFFRSRIVPTAQPFRPEFKDVGDADFVIRTLRRGAKAACTSRHLSAFAFTGQNMSLGENAKAESRIIFDQLPWYVRIARHEINAARRAAKALYGAYRHQRIEYSLFVGDQSARTRFVVGRADVRWPQTKSRDSERVED